MEVRCVVALDALGDANRDRLIDQRSRRPWGTQHRIFPRVRRSHGLSTYDKEVASACNMHKSVVTFSHAAVEQLSHLAKQHNTPRLLLFVKGGGCNGLRYGIEPILHFDPGIPSPDPLVALNEQCSVQVCTKSLPFLFGTRVDWKVDAMGQGFEFLNPNAKGECGCGSTFSV